MNKTTIQRSNIIWSLILSFFSLKFYRQVLQVWGGRTFWFVLLAIAILWIGFVARFILNLEPYFLNQISQITRQFPTFNIKNGVVTSQSHKAVLIHAPNSSHVMGLVDTEKLIDKKEPANLVFVMGKDGIFLRTSNASAEKIPYNKNWDVQISPQYLSRLAERYSIDAKIYGASFLYVLGGIIAFIVYLILISCLSVIIEGIVSIANYKITFAQAWRLTAVALTPAALVVTLCYAFKFLFPVTWIIIFVVGLFYMCFAVFSCHKLLKKPAIKE